MRFMFILAIGLTFLWISNVNAQGKKKSCFDINIFPYIVNKALCYNSFKENANSLFHTIFKFKKKTLVMHKKTSFLKNTHYNNRIELSRYFSIYNEILQLFYICNITFL